MNDVLTINLKNMFELDLLHGDGIGTDAIIDMAKNQFKLFKENVKYPYKIKMTLDNIDINMVFNEDKTSYIESMNGEKMKVVNSKLVIDN